MEIPQASQAAAKLARLGAAAREPRIRERHKMRIGPVLEHLGQPWHENPGRLLRSGPVVGDSVGLGAEGEQRLRALPGGGAAVRDEVQRRP